MDPRVHRRYLDYLELREYFARPDLPKLDAARFESLDAELGALIARQERGEIDADGASKMARLRRMLLRD